MLLCSCPLAFPLYLHVLIVLFLSLQRAVVDIALASELVRLRAQSARD